MSNRNNSAQAVPALDSLADAELELCDAKAQLVMAEGAAPSDATIMRNVAMNALAAARRHIEHAAIAIEREIYEPEAR